MCVWGGGGLRVTTKLVQLVYKYVLIVIVSIVIIELFEILTENKIYLSRTQNLPLVGIGLGYMLVKGVTIK